jgi:hypothetical protein
VRGLPQLARALHLPLSLLLLQLWWVLDDDEDAKFLGGLGWGARVRGRASHHYSSSGSERPRATGLRSACIQLASAHERVCIPCNDPRSPFRLSFFRAKAGNSCPSHGTCSAIPVLSSWCASASRFRCRHSFSAASRGMLTGATRRPRGATTTSTTSAISTVCTRGLELRS